MCSVGLVLVEEERPRPPAAGEVWSFDDVDETSSSPRRENCAPGVASLAAAALGDVGGSSGAARVAAARVAARAVAGDGAVVG
jgi:hypothetical protein